MEVLVSNTGFTMSKYFIAPGKTQKMTEGALKTQLDGGRQVVRMAIPDKSASDRGILLSEVVVVVKVELISRPQ